MKTRMSNGTWDMDCNYQCVRESSPETLASMAVQPSLTLRETKIDRKKDGLENVSPFKHGVILGSYVRFQGCSNWKTPTSLLLSDYQSWRRTVLHIYKVGPYQL